MNQRFIFVFILLVNEKVCYCSDLNADARGLKMSANDNFTIYTLESYKVYFLHLLSGSVEIDCDIQYAHTNFFVYSLSAITMHDNSTISFVQIAENITSNDVVLSRITMDLNNCSDLIRLHAHDTIIWSKGHQEYMSIKIDAQEKFAYVFADSFVLSYDLSTNIVDQFIETANGTFWLDQQVTVRAFDLTNELALVAGYSSFPQMPSRSISKAFLVQLRPLRVISYASIDNNTISTDETLTYNRDYDLSIALDSSGLLAAIGAPHLNRVVIAEIPDSLENETSYDIDLELNQFSLYASVSSGILGYGRSVTWLDDRGTLAVLVETSTNQVWSTSDVRVYSNISYSTTITDAIPDFVFPNNQQTLGNYLSELKPGFIQILSQSTNLLVLTNVHRLLYIPKVGPGQNAVLLTSRSNLFTYVFEANPCLSGTYKNDTSIGPCTVCPPQTKNPRNGDTFPVTECLPCEPTSFCPLGATNDLNLTEFLPYIQTFTYLDSPSTDNFDDLLLINLFTLGNKLQCIVISPVFWMIVTIIFCFIIWLVMHFLKIYERRGMKSFGSHRKRAKNFFKHVDVIFDAERWIGGLASLIVFVLIVLTSWFSLTYYQLYPFETDNSAFALCHPELYNSDFSNALQLPLSSPNGSRWTIFDMLDSQPFSLSVDLINSPIKCTDIRIQHNRRFVRPISIPIQNCTIGSNNITLSFSFDLPAHTTTTQIDIIGPYFIGAVRFCLHGPSNIVEEVNILHELDACFLFYTLNQTIALSTDFTVRLIKVVNVTKPLTIEKADQYDGRWAPTITTDSFSDKLIFEQNGQYMRYISDRITFNLEFIEESYFLQNNQKPIIHDSALAFHMLLFVSLIIEIFTVVFIFYRMCCRPLLQKSCSICLRSCRKQKNELELDSENNNVSSFKFESPLNI